MLTDAHNTCTLEELFDVANDNRDYLEETDDKTIASALAWQCRDLDRLRSRDSDELADRW